MSYYSDPTASKAIGAVDKELRQMQRKAMYIKGLKEKGMLTPEELKIARKQFVGIYRRLLMEALAE